MTVLQLDHVNIRTSRLADCIDFYGQILGLRMIPPPTQADMMHGAMPATSPAIQSSTLWLPSSWSRVRRLSAARPSAA